MAAAASPSRAAASLLSIASFTPSTLCAPSVCGSSAKASSRSREGSHTAGLALTNCLCEIFVAGRRNNAKETSQMSHPCRCWNSLSENEATILFLPEILKVFAIFQMSNKRFLFSTSCSTEVPDITSDF